MPVKLDNQFFLVRHKQKAIVEYMRRYRYFIILTVLICIVATTLCLKYTVSSYQINGTLHINSGKVYTEKALLKLIDTLYAQSANKNSFRKPNKYLSAGRPLLKGQAKRSSMVKNLTDLNMSPGLQSNIILFDLKNSDPKMAKTFIDHLVNTYIENKKQRAYLVQKEERDSLRYLQKQLVEIEQRIKNNVGVLADKQGKSNKAEKEKNLDVLNILRQYLNKPKNTFVLVPAVYVTNNTLLKQLIARYNIIQLKRQSMLSAKRTYKDIIAKETQLQKLQEEISREIAIQKDRYGYADSIDSNWLSASVKLTSSSTENVSLLKVKQASLLQKLDSFQIKQSIGRLRSSERTLPAITRTEFNVEPLQPESPFLYIGAVLVGLVIPGLVVAIRKRYLIYQQLKKATDFI